MVAKSTRKVYFLQGWRCGRSSDQAWKKTKRASASSCKARLTSNYRKSEKKPRRSRSRRGGTTERRQHTGAVSLAFQTRSVKENCFGVPTRTCDKKKRTRSKFRVAR